MSHDAGLPDGCSANMLPYNNRDAEMREIHYVLVKPDVERQARCDLLALCKAPGKVRNHFLDASADQVCNHAQFVALQERINSELWQDACEHVYRAEFADTEF